MVSQNLRMHLKQALHLYRSRPSLVARRNPYSGRAYSTQQLRYAIVGCGDIGYRNAEALLKSPNSTLAAVCDVVPDLTSGMADQYNVIPYNDYGLLLEDQGVDVLVIALPHHLHAQFTVAALEAGKHVIVEKPMAITLEECHRMMEAERQSGKVLSVCFPQRYTAKSLVAKDLVQAGHLGEVHNVTITCNLHRDEAYWTGGFSGRSKTDWRKRRDQAGGGVLVMNAIHWLDLAMWIMESPISGVQAWTQNSDPEAKDVEDRITMHFTIGDQGMGVLMATTVWPGIPVEQVEIAGEHGVLVVGQDLWLRLSRDTADFKAGRNYLVVESPTSNERSMFYSRFSEAVLQGQPADIPSVDGFKVQEIVAAVYQTASLS